VEFADMSFSRQFLVCVDEGHAAVCDQLCLEFLNDHQSACWSGIYERSDGAIGVAWKAPLSGLLGPVIDEDTGETLLPVVEEVKTAEGVSDWALMVEEPDAELP